MSGAKCLRCGAGSEWIKGKVPNEPESELAAPTTLEQFKLTSVQEWQCDLQRAYIIDNIPRVERYQMIEKIRLEGIKHGMELGAKMARDGWSFETILAAAKEFKL